MITRREFLAMASAVPLLPKDDRFVVHEWGVLTVPQDATWAAVRTAGCSFDAKHAEVVSNPPEFAHTWSALVGKKIEEWEKEPVIVLKPVVYFYSPEARMVSLRLDVPLGRPAVWWPPAKEFAPLPDFPNRGRLLDVPESPKIEKIAPKNGFLHWPNLAIHPQAECTREVRKDHWWATARDVDASGVTSENESDRFVFYDALTPVASSLRVEGDEVTNVDSVRIPHAIAVRVKNGKTEVAAVDALDGSAKLRYTDDESALEKRLVRSGLFEKEARSMARIWHAEFFRAEGYRVLYWMPASRIEEILPMKIEPAPDKLVRVILVQIECLGPEGRKEVQDLIEKLGSDDLDEREAATERLRKLGPRVEGALRRAMRSDDPEIRARAQFILESMGLK